MGFHTKSLTPSPAPQRTRWGEAKGQPQREREIQYPFLNPDEVHLTSSLPPAECALPGTTAGVGTHHTAVDGLQAASNSSGDRLPRDSFQIRSGSKTK